MRKAKHTQRSLAAEMGPNGPKERSIRSAMRKVGTKAYAEIPPTHQFLAAHFGWAPGSIEEVLAGGEPTYLAGAEPEPRTPAPMDPAVKAEWRRQVQASPMSGRAKRETLAFIDTIPDAE